MKAWDKLNRLFRVPKLTRMRIAFALVVAVIADGLQFIFGPVPLVDEAVDLIAFLVTARTVGFHLLLLPTFVVKFIPVADMLPTWTACVIYVVAMRKREQNLSPPPKLEDLRE
jgi:hypothetical protein